MPDPNTASSSSTPFADNANNEPSSSEISLSDKLEQIRLQYNNARLEYKKFNYSASRQILEGLIREDKEQLVVDLEGKKLFADIRHHLGKAHISLADYEKANELLLQVVDEKKKLYGEYHNFVADTYHHLGRCRRNMGEQMLKNGNLRVAEEHFQKAEEYLRTTMTIKTTYISRNQDILAMDTLHQFAKLHLAQGDLKYQQSKQARKAGEDDRAIKLQDEAKQNYHKALGQLRSVLTIKLIQTNQNDFAVADTRYELGRAFQAIGSFAEAYSEFIEAQRIRKDGNLSDDHPKMIEVDTACNDISTQLGIRHIQDNAGPSSSVNAASKANIPPCIQNYNVQEMQKLKQYNYILSKSFDEIRLAASMIRTGWVASKPVTKKEKNFSKTLNTLEFSALTAGTILCIFMPPAYGAIALAQPIIELFKDRCLDKMAKERANKFLACFEGYNSPEVLIQTIVDNLTVSLKDKILSFNDDSYAKLHAIGITGEILAGRIRKRGFALARLKEIIEELDKIANIPLGLGSDSNHNVPSTLEIMFRELDEHAQIGGLSYPTLNIMTFIGENYPELAPIATTYFNNYNTYTIAELSEFLVVNNHADQDIKIINAKLQALEASNQNQSVVSTLSIPPASNAKDNKHACCIII